MRIFFTFLLFGALLAGCYPIDETDPRLYSDYLRPVYQPAAEVLRVRSLPPKALQKPGRIYVNGNLLLIAEEGKGVHVINNADPKQPEPLAYIEVPGTTNLAMYSHYLYLNNHTDLVVLDLSNLADIKEVNRVKDQFATYQAYPPQFNVAFECADPAKGVVVAWESAVMPEKVKCFR